MWETQYINLPVYTLTIYGDFGAEIFGFTTLLSLFRFWLYHIIIIQIKFEHMFSKFIGCYERQLSGKNMDLSNK